MLLFKNTPLIWGCDVKIFCLSLGFCYYCVALSSSAHSEISLVQNSTTYFIIKHKICSDWLWFCLFGMFLLSMRREKSHLIRSGGRLVELWVNCGLGLAVWCHKWLAVAFLLLHSPSAPVKIWQMWKSLVQEGNRARHQHTVHQEYLFSVQVTNRNMYNNFLPFLLSYLQKVFQNMKSGDVSHLSSTFMIKNNRKHQARTHIQTYRVEQKQKRRIITCSVIFNVIQKKSH